MFLKNRKKVQFQLISVLMIIAMLFSSCVSAFAETDEDGTAIYYPDTNAIENWPQAEAVYGQSCVLIDADTGAVLCSLGRNVTRYPASTTKIMTALLTVENCSLDEIVTMTSEGTAGVADDSSNAGTQVGEEFTVEECLYMLLLKSANDIANQLGVHVAGSIEAFAEMMTARAEEIGCTGTHFHNCSGMPDDEHYTTPMDLAKIMQVVIQNDVLRKIIGTVSHTVPATNMSGERYYENHNMLINKDGEYYYEYCIGGKTGFTNAAQRTLVTAAEKDGHTLICVTMKTPDKSDYYDQRHLYNYGFDNFTWRETEDGTIVLPNEISSDPFKEIDVLSVVAGSTSDAAESTADSAADSTASEPAASEPAASSGAVSAVIPATQAVYPVVKTINASTTGYSAEVTDYGTGTVSVRYIYNDIPVGSASVRKPTPTPTPEVTEAPEPTPEPAPEKRERSVIEMILLVLFLISLVVFLGAIIMTYRKLAAEQRAEERARRRAARRRETEHAWANVVLENDDSDDWEEPENDEEPAENAADDASDESDGDDVKEPAEESTGEMSDSDEEEETEEAEIELPAEEDPWIDEQTAADEQAAAESTPVEDDDDDEEEDDHQFSYINVDEEDD